MTVADIVRLTVSEATGIHVSQLTDDTPVSDLAIGRDVATHLTEDLVERLQLGWMDQMYFSGETVGELIDAANALVPVYFEPGSQPRSVKIDVNIFRWHPARHAPTFDADTLRAAFEDGPWKWDTQSRFAGSGINPGHYFGLTEDAATAEVKYYGSSTDIPTDLVLLTLNVALDNVLDLTNKETAVYIVKESVDLSRYDAVGGTSLDLSEAQLLSWLFADTKGGNGVTDYVGYSAHRGGYSGILFFGARAMPEIDRWSVANAGAREQFNNDFECVRALRRNRDYFNLVIFSGARVVSATKTYRSGGPQRVWGRSDGMFRKNPFFGWDESRLLSLSIYDGDFQDDKGSGLFASKPIA